MTLGLPWRKVVCPYCFTDFRRSEAPRRSIGTETVTMPDERVGAFFSCAPPLMGPVLPPVARPRRGRNRREKRAVLRLSKNDKRICPHCHLDTPHATARGELTNRAIAIMGNRGSGKSNYLGVLIQAIAERYGSEVGFNMVDLDSFSVREMRTVPSHELWRQRYGCLFDPHGSRAVEQTPRAERNPEIRIPLIYRLQVPKGPLRRIVRPFGSFEALDLSFFEAAGEDEEDPQGLERFCMHLLHASGIICLIDPFRWHGFRGRLPRELSGRLPPPDGDPTSSVARLIALFETAGGLRTSERIDLPVAFVLSKCDLLRGVLPRTSVLLQESLHEGGFDSEHGRRLSLEVKEYIREWGNPQFLDLVESRFRTYGFFAVSALGRLPEADLSLEGVMPMRVADPLLWLLWRQGYIGASGQRH